MMFLRGGHCHGKRPFWRESVFCAIAVPVAPAAPRCLIFLLERMPPWKG